MIFIYKLQKNPKNMLTLITSFLLFLVLKSQPLTSETYTCPNGEVYDETTVVTCSDVVHGLPCTIDSESTGTCISFVVENVMVCCPGTDTFSSSSETEIDFDSLVEVSSTTAMSCDDDYQACIDACPSR